MYTTFVKLIKAAKKGYLQLFAFQTETMNCDVLVSAL